VTQENLFDAVPVEKLALLSKEDLIEFLKLEQDFRRQLQKDNERLRALNNELEQKSFLIGDKYIVLKNKLFGKSSEKSPKRESVLAHDLTQKDKKKKVQLPSLRYPDAPLIERHVELKEVPDCSACGSKMKDSGMTEDSEFLTVIPAQYYVIRQLCHKYCCASCHGNIKTAPAPAKVKSGSSYSDEMVIDVAAAKYCDLIPVERYATIAGRAGLEDLPANSLIEGTHYLADFIEPVYEELKKEIIGSQILHADETTHRMLEGDKDKKSWYLWGFSTKKSSYFEIRGTRSGGVASNLLADSKCEFLVSDVFSGYNKAVRDSNSERQKKNINLPLMKNVYCNAHARRKFKESEEKFPEEASFFIEQYKEIYRLESLGREKPDKMSESRGKMEPYFKIMKDHALLTLSEYSAKSSIYKAANYFLKNFEGLTRFQKTNNLPIDNNPQERLMRSPVIGRKTWYGTHSKRGAKTAAVLFSIVESCKLNKVNPRKYLRQLLSDLHAGKPHFTPSHFKSN